jgi:hypothetical protein
MHEYAAWEARKKAAEEDKKFKADAAFELQRIKEEEEEPLDKLSPAAKKSKRNRDAEVQERITELQVEQLRELEQEIADQEEYAKKAKKLKRDALNAQLEAMTGEYQADIATRNKEREEKKDALSPFKRTKEELLVEEKKLADEYKKASAAEDDLVKLKEEQAEQLRKLILTQRKRKDIEEEERDRESAARKGERLDNMDFQYQKDLEIEAAREEIAILRKQGTSSRGYQIDPLTGKRVIKTTSTSGTVINSVRIKELEDKIDRLQQEKFDRKREHAAFDGIGTAYSGGTGTASSFGGDTKLQELQVRMYEKRGFARKLTDQDFMGFKQQGYSDEQMKRIWGAATGGKHNLSGSGSELFDEYVKMDDIVKKSTDTTKTAFKSMADASMGMAESVASAWSFASGVYAMYRQAVQNNMIVNNNTTVPVTFNTATPTLDSSQVATAVKKTLDKQAANNTIKTSYPTTTSPLPTVQSTGTGTITSKKFGTVVIK